MSLIRALYGVEREFSRYYTRLQAKMDQRNNDIELSYGKFGSENIFTQPENTQLKLTTTLKFDLEKTGFKSKNYKLPETHSSSSDEASVDLSTQAESLGLVVSHGYPESVNNVSSLPSFTRPFGEI